MKPKQDKHEREFKRMTKALRAQPGYRPPPSEPPAAEEKPFKEVLHLWNLCPGDWSADDLVNRLGCSKRSFANSHKFYSDQRKRLPRKADPLVETPSAEFLTEWTRPLGKKHRAALNHAAWWHKFTREDYPVVVGYKSERVKRYLCFQDDNLPDSDDDVATLRTGSELIARKSFGAALLNEFWKLKEPPLALVELAQQRWRAYRDARTKARQHFRKLDLPGKLSDYASPADALWHIDQGLWDSDEARNLADKLDAAEKEIIRNPAKLLEYVGKNLGALSRYHMEDFLKRTHQRLAFLSNWNFMARYALGLVSKDELRLTLPTFFLKLTLDEKMDFLKFCYAIPRRIKQNKLALLATWVQDNTPVFSAFCWRTEAVMQILAERFDYFPGSNTTNKNPSRVFRGWLTDCGIDLEFPKGRAPNVEVHPQPHDNLLTPPPLVDRFHWICAETMVWKTDAQNSPKS